MSDLSDFIKRVQQEVSTYPEWQRNLLRDSLIPFKEDKKPMSDEDTRLKAKRIISQWENHDKFRIPVGESSEEPDEVVVAKSLLEADEQIKVMLSIIHRNKTGKGCGNERHAG